VSIRAGDAGGVFVGVDGAAAEALGPDGRAVTRAFTATVPLATPAVATDQGATAAPSAASASTIVPADAPLPGRRPDARTPPSATPTAAASPADVAPVPGVSGARPDLVEAGQQWLDAYQRRDRDAMATTGAENITVSDERSVGERFPAWQSNVRRDLDQVELELVGDNAILTARMTEQADGGGGGEHISRVSQRWQRQNGRWRLADVRIIGEARLNQIIR
jgi:ketosteroid isomerase-like protein